MRGVAPVPVPAPAPVAPPSGSRVPVGTAAFATALYAVLYFAWEQSHWGSDRAVRDLLGNVAFMPLNLGGAGPVLARVRARGDPRPRRPPGAPAARHRSAAWCSSATPSRSGTSLALAREPAGLLGRSVLPLRLAADCSPRCSPSRWRGAPGWSGGSSCSTPRWCWSAARGDLVLLRPARPPRRRRTAWSSPARLRLSAGEHAGAARRSPRCCSAGRSTATGWRSRLLVTGVLGQHRGRPHLQPGAARDRRAQRELDRRRLPARAT